MQGLAEDVAGAPKFNATTATGLLESESEYSLPSEREIDLEEYGIRRYVEMTGRGGRWVCADSLLRRAGLMLLLVLVFLLKLVGVVAIIALVVIVFSSL